MTLLCFSLVFHYNHVFCGVCNVWAISGLAKHTAEHPGRQVGNKNYIIGKLQIFFGLISFSSESAFKMWAGGIGCPAIKTTLSGNICEQSQQCIVSRNWKIAARLRANAGGGVTRLGQPGQFGRRLQFFFYFSICLQNVSSRQLVKKRRAERTSHWDIFFSSMSGSARVEKVINLGLSIFKYL